MTFKLMSRKPNTLPGTLRGTHRGIQHPNRFGLGLRALGGRH